MKEIKKKRQARVKFEYQLPKKYVYNGRAFVFFVSQTV